MSKIETLSALISETAITSLVYNDLGNGCGGPGCEDAGDVLREIQSGVRDDASISEVSDPESMEFAKAAFAAYGLNPASISAVYRGVRSEGENGHQIIYCV